MKRKKKEGEAQTFAAATRSHALYCANNALFAGTHRMALPTPTTTMYTCNASQLLTHFAPLWPLVRRLVACFVGCLTFVGHLAAVQ